MPDTVLDQWLIAVGYGLPSKQTVNGVSGRLQARDVRAGCRLWALDGWRTVQTTVTAVEAVKAREVDSEGTVLAGTAARKLCRERLTVTPGYEFGYLLGANCSDGTVGKNYVSLVVNDEGFAARFAACLTAATGLPARLEAVTRPSGYLKRDVPGFRVRVVSSYLADLMRPSAPRACWSVPTWLSVRARPGGWGQVHAPEQGDSPLTSSWPAAGRHEGRSSPSGITCSSSNRLGRKCARYGCAGPEARSRSRCTATASTPTRAFS